MQRNQTHPLTYLPHAKLDLGGQALRTSSSFTEACFVLVLVVGKMHVILLVASTSNRSVTTVSVALQCHVRQGQNSFLDD